MERVPDQILEPIERRYVPAMSYEEEKEILLSFVKDRFEDFVEYIDNYDSTLFWDFADIEKLAWAKFKEENRIA